MMSSAPEIPVCLCGTPMEVHTGAGDIFRCSNCDLPQYQEIADPPAKRRPTREDHRFNLGWKNRIREKFGLDPLKGGLAQ